MNRFLIAIAGVILFSFSVKEVQSQKTHKDTLTMSTTIVSKHLWRAIPSGNAPCIEPYLEYKYGKFAVSAWASYAIDGSYSEIDLWASYTIKNFTVTFLDYYCPRVGFNENFFNYNSTSSRHLRDVQLTYNATEKFPFTLTGSTMIWGVDKDVNGDLLYSTYFEIGHSRKFRGKTIDFVLGMTPFEGMYAKDFSVFNYGVTIKDKLKITDKFSLPVQSSLVFNTELKKMFFTFGFIL